MEISPWFVMCLGMGTVFVGLYVLILLTQWMSAIIRRIDARHKEG